jgi:formate-dependent nitrite reductase membrane component NrfD
VVNVPDLKKSMDLELMKPRKQRVWRWPAVINFVLGGTGAGFYLFASVIELIHEAPGAFTQRAYPYTGPLLVCLGLLAVSFETGRPFRLVYILKRMQKSWISLEVMTGIFFVFFAIAGRIFPSALLLVCGATAALGFILSQGFIMYRARGITGWNVPLIPVLFLTSALASGGGLLLIMSSFEQVRQGDITLMIVQVSLAMDVTAWAIYLTWSRDRYFMKAIRLLRRPLSLLIISGVGHLLPFAMIAGLLVSRQNGSSALEIAVTGFIGVFIITGAMSGKILLLLGTNFIRPVILSREHAPTLKKSCRLIANPGNKVNVSADEKMHQV